MAKAETMTLVGFTVLAKAVNPATGRHVLLLSDDTRYECYVLAEELARHSPQAAVLLRVQHDGESYDSAYAQALNALVALALRDTVVDAGTAFERGVNEGMAESARLREMLEAAGPRPTCKVCRREFRSMDEVTWVPQLRGGRGGYAHHDCKPTAGADAPRK